MPKVTRMAMRRQGKYLREAGEQVILLIPQDSVRTTATPDDIVTANQSLEVDNCTRYPIYASVKWHSLDDIKFEAGGKAIFRKADIVTSSEYQELLAQCVAIEMYGSYVLRKTAENLSQTDATYTLTVEGYVRTQL